MSYSSLIAKQGDQMNTYVALFRGINVGGKTTLSMKSLVALFSQLGFEKIETYIRSGNIIFSSAMESTTEIGNLISKSIKVTFSFTPGVLVLQPEDIRAALKGNPFPDTDPKAVQIGFLWQEAENPDLGKMNELKKETEELQLSGKVFYLYAPEGIGRSKLAATSKKLLGVTKTDRNLRTVKAIEDILDKY